MQKDKFTRKRVQQQKDFFYTKRRFTTSRHW